jgi:hypothetical protein
MDIIESAQLFCPIILEELKNSRHEKNKVF